MLRQKNRDNFGWPLPDTEQPELDQISLEQMTERTGARELIDRLSDMGQFSAWQAYFRPLDAYDLDDAILTSGGGIDGFDLCAAMLSGMYGYTLPDDKIIPSRLER